MAPHARLANRALTLELRRRSGLRLRDLGPMRAARRDALLALEIADRRFGWPLEMVLLAAAAGWRISEVEVPYRARAGRSKVTGTVRGTVRTMRDMAGVLQSSPGRHDRRPGEQRRALVTALVVIAKAPVAGRSKTRLTPPCTPEQAADLARRRARGHTRCGRRDPRRATRRRPRWRGRAVAGPGLRGHPAARGRPGRAACRGVLRCRLPGARRRHGHPTGHAAHAVRRARRARRRRRRHRPGARRRLLGDRAAPLLTTACSRASR